MNIRHYLSVVRYFSFFFNCKKHGNNIRLGPSGHFSRPQEITFGSNIYIGPNFHISARKLTLGDNILIGPNFLLEGEDHIFEYVGKTIWETRHEKNTGFNIIENDVWIGGNVTVLKNVKISEGCIVGAGSVVTKSLPPYTICVGVPCKPLKLRFTHEFLKEHLEKIKSNYLFEDVIKNKI